LKYDTLHEAHEYKEKIDEVAPPSEGATPRFPVRSDEAETVQRASQGDKDALITLYEKYIGRIYRYFYTNVGNIAEAEDLTSELFIRAVEALMRGKYVWQDKPFEAWLFGITRYMLKERWRKLNGLPLIENLDTLLEAFEPTSQEMDIPDTLVEKEEQTAVWDLVKQLPLVEQQVLIMRYVYNLPYNKIATRLERSESACKQLHYRALTKLKRLMQNNSSTLG
jgi:RNA polymerase sigma factor (sigma-70 family)